MMRRLGGLLCAALLLSCTPHAPPQATVDAAQYDAFWLWAGVAAQPVLDDARTLYLLEGEVLDGAPVALHRRLGATPRIGHAQVWIVYRTDTLAWPSQVMPAILRDVERWQRNGNRVVGVQLDFDARTRGLHDYAAFLQRVRAQMPTDLKLSITGLLDWSANGDPRALAGLQGTVDEVVLQTYQGRHTIPGHASYLRKLPGFPLPFRIGLVQDGQWQAPPTLASNRNFRGYVVFLLNPSAASAAPAHAAIGDATRP